MSHRSRVRPTRAAQRNSSLFLCSLFFNHGALDFKNNFLNFNVVSRGYAMQKPIKAFC